MKCPLCGVSEMKRDSAQRFGPIARVLWGGASVVVLVGGLLAVATNTGAAVESLPQTKAVAVAGYLSFAMCASLVLSGVPVWSCPHCDHHLARK